MEPLNHICSRWNDLPLGAIDRRTLLRTAALSSLAWLTPAAYRLAQAAEQKPREPAQSLIFLWLDGGPSQLETFDPHAGKSIAAGTQAISTALAGVQLAAGLERVAEQMGSVTLVRNLLSKEGDHQRGSYYVKTGYRPDPTVIHPSIGAICCHQLPAGKTEIPRHISILPNLSERFFATGGLLGNQYDAFKTGDPLAKVPDIASRVSPARARERLADEQVIETAFARGRRRQADSTLHRDLMNRAVTMMTSEQLSAFDVTQESAALRAAYGETPFGRGCLAARRLIEVGVRCVEVTLSGWDSHVNNHEIHRERVKTLDPALSALLTDLRQRDLLDKTIVVCGGEFGRSPTVNRLGGRDHWPHGFSMLLAGGRLRRGFVLGETDPEGQALKPDQAATIPDLHATLLTALGIDPAHEEMAPIGRPIKFSDGEAIAELLV